MKKKYGIVREKGWLRNEIKTVSRRTYKELLNPCDILFESNNWDEVKEKFNTEKFELYP